MKQTPRVRRSIEMSINYDSSLDDLRALVEATKEFDGTARLDINVTQGDPPYSYSDSYSLEVQEK